MFGLLPFPPMGLIEGVEADSVGCLNEAESVDEVDWDGAWGGGLSTNAIAPDCVAAD